MTTHQILHIVLVQWKPELEADHFTQLNQLLTSVTEKVPGVLTLHQGKSDSSEGLEHGYDWALAITFESADARDKYLPHPAHEPVKAMIGKWAANILVFDLHV